MDASKIDDAIYVPVEYTRTLDKAYRFYPGRLTKSFEVKC